MNRCVICREDGKNIEYYDRPNCVKKFICQNCIFIATERFIADRQNFDPQRGDILYDIDYQTTCMVICRNGELLGVTSGIPLKHYINNKTVYGKGKHTYDSVGFGGFIRLNEAYNKYCILKNKDIINEVKSGSYEAIYKYINE